jgi:4'-phosphopantetheinyl transferase
MTHTVHLYVEKPAAIYLANAHLLNTAEQQRANAFRFEKDRELYTAAHIFLRQTLSQHADITPADWQFSHNAYGKPTITNRGYETLQFNLSHTQGMLACAVSNAGAIGVDVERHKPLQDVASLCHTALADTERADVLSNPDATRREQRFFTYWTLKEAYLKALGMGLSLPLQQFSFRQGKSEQWRLHCQTALPDDEGHWQFLACQIDESHSLALAVQIANFPDQHACVLNHSRTVLITASNSANNACWSMATSISPVRTCIA